MEWVAISGSWRNLTLEIESEVRDNINEIIGQKNGIVSGGALGVDWIATDQAIKLNPKMDKIKIFLPTNLDIYEKYYFKKAEEGKITKDQAQKLISQLKEIKNTNKKSLIECSGSKVNKKTYFKRIDKIIENSDKLLAFRVNKSEGVTYTIQKAEEKGIPLEVYDYQI